MARIRTIKPEFFRHEALYESERDTGLPLRVAFAGLWTTADREGRFKWKPKQLKLDCLPFDEVDFSAVLDALASINCIIKYQFDGELFGFIPSWKEHQVINQRESQSSLPEPSTETHMHACASTCNDSHIPNGVNIPIPLRETVFDRDGRKCLRCGAEDDLTIDHIFPQSIGGNHSLTNLRILCRSCNSRRPVAGQALIDDLKKDGLTLDDMQRMCMHVQTHGEGKGKEGKGKEGKGKEGAVADAPKKNAKTMLAELGVEEQPAKDWLEIRKAKRAPLTQTALDDLVREAGKAGITVNEAVTICARRSWQGFNASWDWQGKGIRAGELDKDQAREGARARLFGEKNAAE